jgi:Glycosyltransferase family 87
MGGAALAIANTAGITWFGDADWYAAGLPALTGHHALYPADYLVPHVAVRPPQFNQPPAAVLVAPLAALGRLPWGILMASAFLVGLCLIWPRVREPWGWVLAGALIAWIPVTDAVVWANLNSVVFLLLVIAVRWPRHAGWAIGAATALRLAPVTLVGWLVGRRDWRNVGIAVAVAGLLTLQAMLLTSPSALWDFVIVRVTEAPSHDFGAFSLALIGMPPIVGYAAAGALTLVAAWRGSLTVAVAALLIGVPDMHAHYWILLLVPLLRMGDPAYALERPFLRRLRPAWLGAT